MKSLRRQREIYLEGFAGKIPKTPISYTDLEQKAREILSHEAFAYFAGGAGNESTIYNNRQGFESVKIHPHMLSGSHEVSMELKWNAQILPVPFMLAPIGVLELASPSGDLGVAMALSHLGVPMIISNQASYPMERIAEQLNDCPRLFQLYFSKSHALSRSFIRRAEAIGCSAIVVTLDTTMLGWRTRDLSLGYSPFLHGKGIAQYYSDPVFNDLPDPQQDASTPAINFDLIESLFKLNQRIPGGFVKNTFSKKAIRDVRKFTSVFSNPEMNWNDIESIRQWTDLPIYLKGILRADDAVKAAATGVDGIIVSNHGGRQIDGSVSTIEALASIIHEVKGSLEVWMDSGIRTGSDIFKALAIGAKGVMIGRPYVFSLAVNGAQGVADCILNLMADLELTMALSGCRTLNDIKPDLISHPWKNT